MKFKIGLSILFICMVCMTGFAATSSDLNRNSELEYSIADAVKSVDAEVSGINFIFTPLTSKVQTLGVDPVKEDTVKISIKKNVIVTRTVHYRARDSL